jgi:ubiquitin-activating enzyme E1
MSAFFGGIVAQEIVKFTGKYSPLKQWLHYDIFETLPRAPVDRTPLNCRYDD